MPKDSLRVEAYGEVDELNACIGLARAEAERTDKILLEKIQKALVGLMGELAVAPEDANRYEADGYAQLKEADLALLDREIDVLEKAVPKATGWSTPGGSLQGATLALARTVCRRAERGVWKLDKKEGKVRTLIPKYLNRLSDLLWLLERAVETRGTKSKKTRKA